MQDLKLKDDTARLPFSDRWRWVTQSRLVGIVVGALFNTCMLRYHLDRTARPRNGCLGGQESGPTTTQPLHPP